jgi:hypothetical protein
VKRGPKSDDPTSAASPGSVREKSCDSQLLLPSATLQHRILVSDDDGVPDCVAATARRDML